MALPSVLTEDVLSPAGVSAAAQVSDNLQQIANRAAQMAAQKAQLEAQSKLQQKQLDAEMTLEQKRLDATAKQYSQYQDFQAREAEKQRAFQETQYKDEQSRIDTRNQELYTRQDAAIKQANEWRLAEANIAAQKARAVSDAAKGLNGQLEEHRKKVKENEDQLGVLMIEEAVNTGKSQELLTEAMRTASDIDASRIATGQSVLQETGNAITELITDEISTRRSGVAGLVQRGAKQEAFGGAPFGQGPTLDIIKSGVANVADWLGFEYVDPAQASGLTDTAKAADALAKKLAPKLSAIGTNGPETEAALTNFFRAGVKAQQTIAGDGAIKGADERAVVEEFKAAAAKLKDQIGDSALDGLVRALGETKTPAFDPEQTSKLRKGERSAIQNNFKNLGRIQDVYDMVAAEPGSPLAGRRYDDKITDFLAKVLNSYATSSMDAADFQHQLKRLGIKPSQVEDFLGKAKQLGVKDPTMLNKRLKELSNMKESLEGQLDIISRQSEAGAIGEGGRIEAEMYLDLAKQLGLE